MLTQLYTYEPLHTASGSIRLLQILEPRIDGIVRCKLVPGNIDSSCFRALSYVWGPATETYSIELNGKLWKIRKSLYTFLKRAQNEYWNELVWVDALCINQDDVLERNQQVSQMGKLYRRAFEVLVWLESSLKDSEFFSNFSEDGSWQGLKKSNKICSIADDVGENRLQSWSGWCDLDNETETVAPLVDDMEELEPWSNVDQQTSRRIFAEVGNHPYWTRAWVVQEFCLAKSITFVSSNMTLPFLQFERAFLLTDPDSEDVSEPDKRISELIFWRSGNDQAVTDDAKLSYPDDLFGLLQRFGRRNCTDSRDRVFALVGMSKEVDQFKIDYGQNNWQVFISVLQTLGTDRFSAAILLFEILGITVDNIPLTDLPTMTFTFPLASGFLVLNGGGARVKSQQLWLCECGSCTASYPLFNAGEQVLVKRTSQTSLWLLYTLAQPEQLRDNDVPVLLKFTACATPVDPRGDKLCAFLPKTPLLALFHDSQIMLRMNQNSLPTVCLNEKSIFAYTFCAASRSSEHFEHKAIRPPSKDTLRQGNGSLGVLYTEWDWRRSTLLNANVKD